MNRQATKHGDELLARAVMQAALGVPVVQHDDQSRQGMYDLAVQYPDGRQAAAEVVSTRNQQAWELEAAARKLGYVRCSALSRLWVVLVEPGARLKALAQEAPDLLAQLERDGITELRRTFHDPWPPRLRALGAVACWSHPSTVQHPPGFYLNSFPTGAFAGDGNDAVQAAEKLLAVTPDVPAKLLASGLSERHAVVVVTVDWLGPFSSLEAGAVPSAVPTLPAGVDCLWLVVFKLLPIRAVYWLGDGAWRDVVVTEEQLDELG